MTDVAVEIGHFEPGSDEWHAARAHGLGGSEIAAVLGLSQWCSKFTLWCHKTGLLPPGRLSSPSMEWGHRLEPVVAAKFTENHPQFMSWDCGTFRSRRHSWQIANPDRILIRSDGTRAIYEGKTADSHNGWEWGESGTDEVPVYYRCQALWYLDVFSYEECHLAVLIGGNDYREFLIRYAPDEAQLMRHAGAEFMDSVAFGRRPDIDDSTSTYRTIRHLNPLLDGAEKEIPEPAAVAYIGAHSALRYAEGVKRRAAAVVLDAMGTATYATCNGERFARRDAKNGGVPYLTATLTRKDTE